MVIMFVVSTTYAAQKPIKKTKKVSLKPLPVEIFYNEEQRPAVAFTTPCLAMAGAVEFPPVKMFEFMALTMIDNVNATNILPVSLEPVCS